MADKRIDDETRATIRRRAQDLAAQAPALTPQQVLMLRAIVANRAGADRA